MKILTICKRSPQGRDMMRRPYGRFHHLPRLLQQGGDEVLQAYIGFRGDAPLEDVRDGVRRVALAVSPAHAFDALHQLHAIAGEFSPDWVAGFSDSWCGVIAGHLAGRVGARSWLDAYDNYEAYMPWNLPLHLLWRKAVRNADLVTAAGPQLAALLQAGRRRGRPVAVLPMAADPVFLPRDRQECRARLGLPGAVPLIGYVGSWTRGRGTHLILDALRELRRTRPELHLVLSGRPPAEALREPGVIGVGYLEDEKLPLLVSALDVACIVIANSRFGSYSYPAKMYEAMACGIPVVASDTEAARWILDDGAGQLAAVGDAGAFAQAVLAMLTQADGAHAAPRGWDDHVITLRRLLSADLSC